VVLVEVIQAFAKPEQEIIVICDTRYSVLSIADVPRPEYGCSGRMYIGPSGNCPRSWAHQSQHFSSP